MTHDPATDGLQPADVSTRSLARNTLLNYVSSIFNLLNGVAISILMARFLGPKQLGVYSGASFVVGLGLAIFGFGIAATAIKILSEYSARFDRATIAGVVRLFAFGVLVPASLCAIAIGVALPLSTHDDRYSSIVGLAALSAIPAHLAQSYRGIVNGFQEFGYLLRINLTGAGLLLACSVAAAFVHPTVGAFILAGIVPNLFIVGAILWHYRQYLFVQTRPAPLPRERLHGIVSFLWPVALITILDMIVWQYSEVLFLGAFRPAQEVAFYSISFWLATLLLRAVASSVTAGFVPALSQLYGIGDEERIRLAFYMGLRFALLFIAPLAAMIAVVARPVVLLLYGEPYLEAASYVPALVTAAGLGAVAGIAADVMYSTRQQRVILVLAAVVAVLNLSLDAWLIPHRGILGAVVANAVAQGVSACGAVGVCFARYRQTLAARSYLGPLALSLLVAAATWPLARQLQGPVAIAAVGVVGTAVYLAGVRAFGVLLTDDARVLFSIATHVPHPATRRALAGLVRFCTPGVDAA